MAWDRSAQCSAAAATALGGGYLASGAGELYDLASDPAEMDNRYDDPACAKVRRELHDMMRARPGAVRSDLAEPVGMA